MPPRFLYFDLGNVVVNFDHLVMCRQMAELVGAEAEQIHQFVFDTDLEKRYEQGEITSRDFYEEFCQQTNSRVDYDALVHASSAIFELNDSMTPVLSQLAAAGNRLGLLSNICENHWQYCTSGRYWTVPGLFEVHALSYRIGAVKPKARIFRAAAEMAGVEPGQIFYCDDIAGHVAGARAAGFDAVQYTTTPALVAELHKRGVAFNY